MKNTIEYLENLNIKNIDNFTSKKRFNDNANYRFEVPGIQSPKVMDVLLKESLKNDILIHRITQTKGAMLLTKEEILEMVNIAQKYEVELFISVGPRATYDTSATVQTKEGSRIGYRLRGVNNLVYAIEDVKKVINLGVKGILIYDEGLLFVLNQMRKDGEIPKDIKFKLSAHMGCSNPASAKLYESIGANSLNPVRDLQIPMIAAIRNTINIPLDLHTENPKSTGGFIRHYEVPKIIKVASPVYLKTGGSVTKNHNTDTSEKEAIARFRQVKLVSEIIEKYCSEFTTSLNGSKDLAIPE